MHPFISTRPLHQGLLIERIQVLLNAFPDRHLKNASKAEAEKIDGLCKGLTIAFEEAYLKNCLDLHMRIHSDIVAWDKSLSSLNEKILDDWFEFIDKILLYQSHADAMQKDLILTVGSSYLFQPIEDKKCLCGYFDFETMEQVLNNRMIEDTLHNGMILIYYAIGNLGHHAVSIRKMENNWYLYDCSHNDLIHYFANSAALSDYIVNELNSALSLIFISFDHLLEPDQEILTIANDPWRAAEDGFFYLFSMQEHNLILSFEGLLREENFSIIAPAAFFGQEGVQQATVLHLVFMKRLGHLFMPLLKYGWGNLASALQIQDKNGYTPLMIMFMHNAEMAGEILELLYQDPLSLLDMLSTVNKNQEGALYFAAFGSPHWVLEIFTKLPMYKTKLIELMMYSTNFGVTGMWAFCKKARPEEIKMLASHMPEYFCYLSERKD